MCCSQENFRPAKIILEGTAMKRMSFLTWLAIGVTVICLGGGRAAAQTNALDTAAAYGSGWGTGTNQGFGFLPWVLANNNGAGSGFAGAFVGNSGTLIDTSFDSFGLYANGGSGGNYSEAYRSFSNALSPGSVFQIKTENTDIVTSGYMGVMIRSSTNVSTVTNQNLIIDPDTAFAFYFEGGQSDYFIWDGNNQVVDSGIPFTTNGLSLQFSPLPGNAYRLVVKSADNSTILQTYSPEPLAGNAGAGGNLTTVIAFNFFTSGGQNEFFNSLEVSSTSLVGPTIVNVFPTNGSIYINPTTNTLSFTVDSEFSTVATNAVSLTLNGITNTNLYFSGASSNLTVTLASNVLAPNLTYTAVIVATDGNGNKATNSTSFNTWSSNLVFIESSDYNFNGGLFISGGTPAGNITPNQYGTQSGNPLAGTNGIDYFKPSPNDGGSNTYRPGDGGYVDLDAPPITADVDHNSFAANGYTDYNLAFVQANEWENYTRSFSSNQCYYLYARMASLSANPTMEIDRYASSTATTSNQALMPLGTAVCPSFTGGIQSYDFVPVTDLFSDPVVVRFNGANTLRSFRNGGQYNFHYFVMVPSYTNVTLRPYLSFGYPFPTATGVALDTTIRFNIANRDTTIPSANIQLSLNGSNVTSGLTISNNAAGALVTYKPPNLLPGNVTNTLVATLTDSAGVASTNTWTFTTENPAVVPTSYAHSSPGTPEGFTIQIAKSVDNAPQYLFPPSVASAEAQLLGPITDTNGQQYVNIAQSNGLAVETNVINYDIDAQNTGFFSNMTAFPDIPAAQTNNYIAMEALMYVPLGPGIYTFGVYSGDGFKFTTGPTPANTNLILGIFDGGRFESESTFDFIIQTNGFYPMRLLYFHSIGGGDVELYTVNRTNGTRILINDHTNPNALTAYQASVSAPGAISITYTNGKAVLNWAGTFTLQSAPTVNGTNSGFTDVAGPVTTGPYTNTPSSKEMFFRLRN
jgi:hypothetical protein